MRHTGYYSEQGRMSWVPAGILLTVLAFVFLPGLALADDRPVVQVNFSIEGDLFNGLTAADLAEIEAKVEEKICTLAEKRWGFLDWSHELPASADTAQWNIALGVEIKQVTNDAGGMSTGFIGTLEHSGLLAARKFSFEQTEENETIYPMGRSIPFQDAIALEDDISRQLDKQLGSLFESWEVGGYLQKIPIVEEVIADVDHTRVLIPVQISDLRTQGDSVLAVFFISPDNNRGRLDLETAAEVVEDGQHKGYVIGRVTDLRLFPVTISTPTWWDDQLSTVLDTATDVKVYMISYSPSLAGSSTTDGNIVLDPDM